MNVEKNIEDGRYSNHKEWNSLEWMDEEIKLKLLFRSDLEEEHGISSLPVELRDRLFSFAFRGVNRFGSARNLRDAEKAYTEVADLVRFAYLVGVAKR